MSMRAREKTDYDQSGESKDKIGQMGGKFKNEMNSMFDSKGKETENYQNNLVQALEGNKKKYD